jgi:hypothetical protein
MKKFPIQVWNWSEAFRYIVDKYPYRVKDFAQSFSENQFVAKTWLIEQLMMHKVSDKKNKVIWIIGSWYGTLLVPLLYKNFTSISEINLVDYDKESLFVANYLFADSIKTHCLDANFDLPKIEADIIINTSCEHMYPMKDFDFSGLCVFQSNNFDKEPAHINCVNSLQEFKDQSGLTKIDFEGEINFHKYDDNYKRYMLIGEK